MSSKKLELEIVALSHSVTQAHSYAVVLGEVNGVRKLPIVIGGFEAQAIAVALENMQPTRPLTHDLMKNMMLATHLQLVEVLIHRIHEGIFYAKLICQTGAETLEIDSRTSDALALAVRFGCPIYTFEHIIEEASVQVEDSTAKKKKGGKSPQGERTTLRAFDQASSQSVWSLSPLFLSHTIQHSESGKQLE